MPSNFGFISSWAEYQNLKFSVAFGYALIFKRGGLFEWTDL